MEIKNTSEDIVFSSVQTIFSTIEQGGNPEGFCLCDQCRMDTICYALNRIEPHYMVSNRGFTRIEMDGMRRQQTEADIASLVYKGLRLVNHNQRPTAPHKGNSVQEAGALHPAFDLPTIAGRIFDGITFEPLVSAKVELRCGGEIVPMRNLNWQNPYTLVSNTPGRFTFWPAPVSAESADARKLFEFSLKIEAPDYEPMNHFFNIQAVSGSATSFSVSMEKTCRLPDLYIFPPGEAEQNG